MKAPYKLFSTSKPRNVEVMTYTDGEIDKPPKDSWSQTLWIERDEDWYALESSQFNHGTVRIITREEYMRSPEIEG